MKAGNFERLRGARMPPLAVRRQTGMSVPRQRMPPLPGRQTDRNVCPTTKHAPARRTTTSDKNVCPTAKNAPTPRPTADENVRPAGKGAIALLCVLLAACNPLASYCEDKVARATQNAARTNYKSGFQAGVAAAIDCIEREGGNSAVAVERCRKRVR